MRKKLILMTIAIGHSADQIVPVGGGTDDVRVLRGSSSTLELCPCPLCYRKQEGDEKKCFLSHTVIFNFVVNAIYHSIGF